MDTLGGMSLVPLTDDQKQVVTVNYGWVKEFVAKLVRRYPYQSYGELLSWASEGLMNAVRLYEEGSVTFETYAKHKIRFAIRDGIRDLYGHRSKNRIVARIDRVTNDLSATLSRSPTAEEISDQLYGISTQVIKQYKDGLFASIETVKPAIDDGDPAEDFNILSEGVEETTPELLLLRKHEVAETHKIVHDAIARARLNDVERQLLLGDEKQRGMTDQVGVSDSRLSQYKRFAFDRVKRLLVDPGYDPVEESPKEELVTLTCWPLAEQFDRCRHKLPVAMRAIGDNYLAGRSFDGLMAGRKSFYGRSIPVTRARWAHWRSILKEGLRKEEVRSFRDPACIRYRRKCQRRLLWQLAHNGLKGARQKRRFWLVHGRGYTQSEVSRLLGLRTESGVYAACARVACNLLWPVWRQGLFRSRTDSRSVALIDRYLPDPLAVRKNHPYLTTVQGLLIRGLQDQGDDKETIAAKLDMSVAKIVGNFCWLNKNRRQWLQSLDQQS